MAKKQNQITAAFKKVCNALGGLTPEQGRRVLAAANELLKDAPPKPMPVVTVKRRERRHA